MKLILWIVFFGLLLIMGFQEYAISHHTAEGYTLLGQEFADKQEGLQILRAWQHTAYGKGTLLDLASRNTHWDFAFILTYVLLLLLHSHDQMQREPTLWLNTLLRLNLLLAVLAGLLDVAENITLFHDFRHAGDGFYYTATLPFTLPKFIFSGWALLVFLFSLLKGRLYPATGALKNFNHA